MKKCVQSSKIIHYLANIHTQTNVEKSCASVCFHLVIKIYMRKFDIKWCASVCFHLVITIYMYKFETTYRFECLFIHFFLRKHTHTPYLDHRPLKRKSNNLLQHYCRNKKTNIYKFHSFSSHLKHEQVSYLYQKQWQRTIANMTLKTSN